MFINVSPRMEMAYCSLIFVNSGGLVAWERFQLMQLSMPVLLLMARTTESMVIAMCLVVDVH